MGKTKIAIFTIQLLITVGITIFDMVSDVMLAADYAKTGKDSWWFALTLTFFILPLPFLLLLVCFTGLCLCAGGLCYDGWGPEGIKFPITLWKQFECVAESGPQLILQLYILAISSMEEITQQDDAVTSGSVTFFNASQDILYSTAVSEKNVGVATVTTDMQDISNNYDETFTFILQMLSISSGLFSMAWNSIILKQNEDNLSEEEGDETGLLFIDYVVELIWNILSISSRVIALALFASVQRYWFGGLITAQVIISISIYTYISQRYDFDCCYCACCAGPYSLMLGINSIFNFVIYRRNKDDHHDDEMTRLPFYAYALYWIVMMIENMAFILIWYFSTNDLDLWYHKPALCYVIVAYFLSFIIKMIHTCTLPLNYHISIKYWIF